MFSDCKAGQQDPGAVEPEECVNYLLTLAQHNVNQYLAREIAGYGITPSQYAVLQVLWESGAGCTPKRIAERLGLETSTISGTLDRMQKKGLIDRQINMEDRREVLVVLQERGRQLQAPMAEVSRRMNSAVLEGLSPQQARLLKGQLRRIAQKKL